MRKSSFHAAAQPPLLRHVMARARWFTTLFAGLLIVGLFSTVIPGGQSPAAGPTAASMTSGPLDQVLPSPSRDRTLRADATLQSAARAPKAALRPLTPAEQQAADLKVAQLQQEYAKKASPADFAKAKAAFEELKHQHDTKSAAAPGAGVTSAGSTASPAPAPSAAKPSGITAARAGWWCSPIYTWELEALAWYVIVVGGVAATLGAFLDVTVVGIPLGAILNAIGIWDGISGTALLWWADTYYSDGSAWVCLYQWWW